ncbi:unnamed protein product (macronuclear) [Paramecium tetraurelia]|uniref:RRM domain-containing protein n=1 Tax=Paramecium tetraurelia TaxID=5888 RepID=A0E3G6_PARTE|nr:uncharacterized protein GSPATT00023006001 [Paramecium tetraurelia]CAK89833.1 unnamed protein product [Paramecium tetraurelia]|eukprot:XP_001457230.1 hypothetical protein (macronuclear) [Paramecium tetraurelia strain d4-2]
MNQPYLHPLQQINQDSAPKETLYVSGLNDKIKLEDLKFVLYILFSQFGEVLQIVMKKTQKLRGQAFIVFQNITYATNAKSALSGMMVYDKPLIIEFAYKKSVIFDRMEGKFYYKQKQQKELQPTLPTDLAKERKQKKLEDKLNNNTVFNQGENHYHHLSPKLCYRSYLDNILVIHLIKVITARGLAFVEYQNDDQATVALKGLSNFKITPECQLKVKYAKK